MNIHNNKNVKNIYLRNILNKCKIILKICTTIGIIFMIKDKIVIKIDNEYKESLYQNNIEFSTYNYTYKILAIFYPDYYLNKTDFNYNNSLIEEKIKLAKTHGIFGFGIVYNLNNEKIYEEFMLNLISCINNMNFPFFIILNCSLKNSCLLNQQIKYNNITSFIFLNISKYLDLDIYIKINEKPLLGIFNSNNINSIFINKIMEYQNEKEKKNPFILYISHGNKNENYSNSINSLIEFSSQDIGLSDLSNNLNKIYFYNHYYYNLLEKENLTKQTIKNFSITNGCHPSKFYITFSKYLKSSIQNNNTFILFNAWNNHLQNSYLEPNDEYGYSYLNYLSKAVFNIEYEQIYNLKNLVYKSKIAVQVHLFYEDLIEDIINKTNNIQVKFDLYITIPSQSIYNKLEENIKQYSKADYYEILIVENKGRDVLPFLKQFKSKYKSYKYLCHIHSKKSKSLWRKYLYNNLLGDINIVSEILNDFETNKKLGFILPETFYGIIRNFYYLDKGTKKWMNFLSSYLFTNCELGKLVNFPAGNMFWSKIKAIYQIFIYDFTKYFPKEDYQTNDTIMHGIERIWLYLVKYNHYNYKVIFKSF